MSKLVELKKLLTEMSEVNDCECFSTDPSCNCGFNRLQDVVKEAMELVQKCSSPTEVHLYEVTKNNGVEAIGKTDLVVAKSEVEAKEKVDDNPSFWVEFEAREIREVDGYAVVLIPMEEGYLHG